jgi:GTP-binding protein
MPLIPTIAIVGRPNVGKSTLFNRLAGQRLAVVEKTPGITRDRLYANCEWENKPFRIIDTGGLQPDHGEIMDQVRQQIGLAIEEADLVLFVVDGKEGLTPPDFEAAELLRKSGKPAILVVNKVETKEREDSASEFYELGMGEPAIVSAMHGIDVDLLLDRAVAMLPEAEAAFEEDDRVKVAIVGRPNVGKSSLLNAVLGEDRAIVSNIPGTTRDKVDTPWEWNGNRLLLMDTAGIRRKSKVEENFEYYSVLRAFSAIERCDVALVVIDAPDGITEQDQRISGFADEQGRAQIIVVNKWDLMEERARTELEVEALDAKQRRTLIADYSREVRHRLAFAAYVPIVFISALRGEGLPALLDTVVAVADQHAMRIPTPELNQLLNEALLSRPLTIKGKQFKIYYAAQPLVKPPTIVLFVNDPRLLHFTYRRYLENQIRRKFGLEGAPLRIWVRESKSKRQDTERRRPTRRERMSRRETPPD